MSEMPQYLVGSEEFQGLVGRVSALEEPGLECCVRCGALIGDMALHQRWHTYAGVSLTGPFG